MIETRAYAKINLRHRVFARDDTGFHAVETLLLRIGLFDSVVLEGAPEGVTLAVDGPEAGGVPTGDDNLCATAVRLFMDRAFPRGPRPGLRIRLTKRIPAGAGLGGGSADAAAALRLLALRWPRLVEPDLVALAGQIGSDVPFALIDVPMALGWGRGQRLIPLRPPSPRPALLVCPPFRIATAEAYARLAESRARSPDLQGATSAGVLPGSRRLTEWEHLSRLVRNDLEGPAFAEHPELADCLRSLRADDALVGMTGSGSALFGLFPDDEEREAAGARIESPGFGTDAGWVRIETVAPAAG